MNIKSWVFFFVLAICACTGFSQDRGKGKVLLSDMTIQMECTEAVDALYNFEFDIAEKQFLWLKQQYPSHPLPYFLMGLSNWWKIMPNDIVTIYDDDFFAYMDTSITMAEKLYDEDKMNPEASFFLAGAYGFKARLQADRENYTSAAFTAKKSLNYLHEKKDNNEDLNPEFLFGKALYNYYREWIPENMPKLKPILLFFKRGDKEKGLEQLKEVADNAFYSRVEATTFLMEIYNDYENKRALAYKYSKYLRETYPNNPYFERYFAKVCFFKGLLKEANVVCESILNKVDSSYAGYGDESGRIISYYSGYIDLRLNKDSVAAQEHFLNNIAFSRKLAKLDDAVLERNYYHYSLHHLAKMADKQGDVNKAIEYYEEYVDKAGKKSKYYKKAKKYLDQHVEKKGWWRLW